MVKIPKKAKKVFEGIIHDVYQWEEDMYDGTKATFEGIKRSDSAGVLAIRGDKIVLSIQEQPAMGRKISTLGGRVDEGETPLEAAKRELLEESGLVSDDWEHYKSFRPGSKFDWQSHIFIARNVEKAQEPKPEAGEKIELFEVTFEEFLENVALEKFRDKSLALDLSRMMDKPEKLEAFRLMLFKK